MKKLLLGSIMITLFSTLIGCQQTDAAKKDIDFIEPEASDSLTYMKTIRAYMYHRTQAVINNDINRLWEVYPKLKNNIDFKKGVNTEKFEVETLNNSFNLLDANYNIESYDRIKVKTINKNEQIVLVHGSIAYLRSDFDESGGEYLMKIFLKKKDKQWTVVKTDEYTLPEYKEWIDEK